MVKLVKSTTVIWSRCSVFEVALADVWCVVFSFPKKSTEDEPRSVLRLRFFSLLSSPPLLPSLSLHSFSSFLSPALPPSLPHLALEECLDASHDGTVSSSSPLPTPSHQQQGLFFYVISGEWTSNTHSPPTPPPPKKKKERKIEALQRYPPPTTYQRHFKPPPFNPAPNREHYLFMFHC